MKHYEVIKYKVYCDSKLHEVISFRKIRFYEKLFWKMKVGNRPSDMPDMEIGKWVVEGLKGYENIPDNIKFVDLTPKEHKK